jgi:ABC-type multidrug transport system fused ATPase/permease subunit
MTADSNFSPAKRIGMFKISWPYVKSVLAQHWRLIALLVVISVLLGIVPIIKSEVEAGLIDEISRSIEQIARSVISGDASTQIASPGSFSEAIKNVLSMRIERFEGGGTDESIPEKLAHLLFGQVGVGLALLIYLALSVGAFAVDFLTIVLQTRISREVFAKLRGIGLTKGLVTDPSHLPALSNVAGQYSNAIQIGAANTGNTYGYLLDAGQHFLSLGTALFLVFTKSPQFAFACLFIVLLQVWLSYIQGRRLRRQRNELDTRRNDLLARTDDVLSKREIILAYERQHDYAKKLEGYTRGYADVDRALDIKEKLYSLTSRLITDYGRMVILLVGVLVTLAIARRTGASQIADIGDAYFFLSIYARILSPATDLLRKYDSLKQSESTSRTFLEVLRPGAPQVGGLAPLRKTRDAGTQASDKPVDETADAVTFQDVYFNYPIKTEEPSQAANAEAERWVLNGVSLRIPARKTTLVLGRSGCGKTTIARILLGFWRPSKGEVTVFGRRLPEYTGDELRDLMAYVSQGDHIIDETVKDNLSWGFTKDRKGIPDDRMLETLAELKVVRTQEERNKILGRPARDLSGGQQHRLSFARMMLDESEIMILDEPFTGVDSFTLSEMRPHLSRIFGSSERTVLVFSHRLAFAKFADHVVIFGEDGKIIEQDSPTNLLAQGGEFAKLYAEARDELKLGGMESSNLPNTRPEPGSI